MHARRAIDALLADGLPLEEERRVRAHLAACEDCRRYYDARVLLERAFAGDRDRATAAEEARAARRALAAVGLDDGRDVGARTPAPTSRRRFFAFALAAGAAVVAAGIVFALPVARVVDGDGVSVGGRPAVAGAAVRRGDLVEIAPGGFAVLESDAARLGLTGGAALSVGLGGREITLERRKVRCDVEKGGGKFRVRTATAEVTVLGTSFVVERREDETTEVRVREGEVRVADRSGRGEVTLREGERSRVRPGRGPSEPEGYSGREDLDLAELLRRIGRGIGRGIDGAVRTLKRQFPGE